MNNKQVIDQVISYWFRGNLQSAQTNKEKSVLYQQLWEDLWFGGIRDDKIDKEIENKFGEHVASAAVGKYDSWFLQSDDTKQNNAIGALAIVILLDQFTRNIYRNKSKSFSNDEKARHITKYSIQHGYDKEMIPVCRAFFFLPLLNSENLEDQNLSVSLYEALNAQFGKKFQSFSHALNC
jgi:uncharacterized protein (DUF924 family)